MDNLKLKKFLKEINSSSFNEEEFIFFENKLLALIYKQYRKKIFFRLLGFFVLNLFFLLLILNLVFVGFNNLKENNFFYLIKILFLDFKEIILNYQIFLLALLENLSFLFVGSIFLLILNIFILLYLTKKILFFKNNSRFLNLKKI